MPYSTENVARSLAGQSRWLGSGAPVRLYFCLLAEIYMRALRVLTIPVPFERAMFLSLDRFILFLDQLYVWSFVQYFAARKCPLGLNQGAGL